MSINISIIVPIYKVEKYIDKCVSSILNQTYKNIEIILVDDGSPDKCPKICDEYAKNDSRIKFIHKKNGGLSDARNIGIKTASGKYILFVDSDDWIENDTCEQLIELAERNDADIVTGEAKRITEIDVYMMKNFDSHGLVYKGDEYLKEQLKNNLYPVTAWINLYKRDFLVKNQLFFLVGVYHEDSEWTPRTFLKANRVISSGYCFYNYLIRENSITTQNSKDKSSRDMILICKKHARYFETLKNQEVKQLLYRNILNMFFYAVCNNFNYYKQNKNELDIKFPVKYANNLKTKFWSYLFLFDIKLFHIVWKIKNYLRNH